MDLPQPELYLILFGSIGLVGLLIVTLLFAIAAAFSSCSLSEDTFEKLKTQEPSGRTRLLWLLNRPLITHRVLLFFQAFFLILATAATTLAAISLTPSLLFAGLIVLAFVILTVVLTGLCQNVAAHKAVSFLLSTAGFTYMLVRTGRFLLCINRDEPANDGEDTFSVGGLEQALEMQKSEEEKSILNSVLHFGEETVAEIMIPRVDVAEVNYHADFHAVMACVLENNYSRIPVRDNAQDKIKGILYVKDLMPYCKEGKDFEWQKLIRPPFFVPESKMIDDLLREFQKTKTHIAIVVDEYGITSGIVTMEDILEEIVGEINDEYDEEERRFIKLDDRHYIFEGKIPLPDFFETLHLNEDSFSDEAGEAETLAGFVLELMNEFPAKHQKATCRQLTFEVLALDKRRISKIKVTIDDKSATADEAPQQ